MSAMRGMDEMQEPLFTTVKLEDFVPADHPLRPIWLLVNAALKRLNGLFSAIDGRTSRHAGYRASQVIRKRIEEHFGWGKTIGRIRQTVYRGIKRVDRHFKLTMVASNSTRMARILAAGRMEQCNDPPQPSRTAARCRLPRSPARQPGRCICNSVANRMRNPLTSAPSSKRGAFHQSARLFRWPAPACHQLEQVLCVPSG